MFSTEHTNTRLNWMKTHEHNLKLRSGRFSIERHHYENIGLTERMVSMFLGGALMARGIKRPFKWPFLYGIYLTYRGFTGQCFFYEQLGIDAKHSRAVNIRGEFEIDRPPQEVYNYWRNLNNLPGSIDHLLNVKVIDENHSYWKSEVLKDLIPIEWDAEIVKDEPGRLIGWRSSSRSLLNHVGKVIFEESGNGSRTLLKVVLSYQPFAGGIGIGLAKFANPYLEGLLKKEIRNFKHTIENG